MGIFTPRNTTPFPGSAARGAAAYQKTMDGQEGLPTDPPPRALTRATYRRAEPGRGAEEQADQDGQKTSPEDSKYRRVAKFLILIGAEEAAKILARLEPEQVEAVSTEIAGIRGITAEEAAQIAGEFRSLLSVSFQTAPQGGVDAARRILQAAFGRERGEAILRRTVPDSGENPFKFLEKLSGEQIAALLKDERPATEALILSWLPPKLSAAVLIASPSDRKIDLVRRIARMGKISPDATARVAASLRERVAHMGDIATTTIDGRGVLTAILKSADPAFGDKLVEHLEWQEPELGQDLRERLHTLDDVVMVLDRTIQEKLQTMNDSEIVLLLKERSQAFIEKILSNVSVERRTRIREEADIMGFVRRRDADDVARRFLEWFRAGREAGTILLADDDDIIR